MFDNKPNYVHAVSKHSLSRLAAGQAAGPDLRGRDKKNTEEST